jgi:alpha-L-rhamnosidase
MMVAEGLSMRRKLFTLLLGIALSVGGSMSCASHGVGESAAVVAGSLHAADLRCEYRVNPVGIDELHPRLSWIVQCNDAAAREKRQSAYQIVVASTRELLACGRGDLWDSGKMVSDATNQIAYAGKDLAPEAGCFWKVRVWDESDQASDYSPAQQWETGLLTRDNWKAKWIGYDQPLAAPAKVTGLAGAPWIWFPEGDPHVAAPVGTRSFRTHVTIPNDRAIASADFELVSDNSAALFVNGNTAGDGNGWPTVNHLSVFPYVHGGDNVLAILGTNVGDAPNPAGIAGRLVVTFDSGEPMEFPIDGSWKSSQTGPEGWQGINFDDSGWVAAKVIAHVGDAPWGTPADAGRLHLPPPPYLRTTFHLDKAVKRATLCASALGIFEMHLNGQRIGQDYFMPGYTDYRKRVYYAAYDVTGDVKQGENALGGILGDGWYAGYLAWTGRRNYFGPATRLGAQLDIEFNDGTTQRIITDDSWKASFGPILHADMLMGCEIDARREMPGWDNVGFDDSNWKPVALTDHVDAAFSAYPANGVQRDDLMPAKTVSQPKPGVYVFDLGQNMVGWVRLKVSGKAGQNITLRHGEMLNPDGTAYTANLRSARSIDEYTLKGSGEETFEPYFTFHGFRYVQVSGLTSEPSLDAVTGVVIHSAMQRTGQFECSNPMPNQLYSNIIWGQKGNYLDIPTDCPQRDERQGWMGDAQVFVRTAAYNYDIAGFFNKWLVDVGDGQFPDGCYPAVSPSILPKEAAAAGWGDAGVICPWTIYHVYGDKQVIAQHYDQMARWIKFLQDRSPGGLSPELGAYGDWLNVDQPTPKNLIATAYFGQSTRLMAEMAHAIGREDDAKKYDDLYQQIRQAFTKAFVSPDGIVKGDSQTGYLLALQFDLVPTDRRDQLASHLIDRIKDRGWHLSTGFLGVNLLLPALSDTGHTDVAYRLLQNTTYPSWGYSIVNGATTIWERWNSFTKEKGFGDVGMNSFNHYSYGSAAQWIFSTMIGIDTDGPAFRKITIRPHPGGGITYAKGTYDSINGAITCGWRVNDYGALTLNVSIPANTRATIYIPATEKSKVTESHGAMEMKFDAASKAVVCEVGSGTYSFTVK